MKTWGGGGGGHMPLVPHGSYAHKLGYTCVQTGFKSPEQRHLCGTVLAVKRNIKKKRNT